MLGEITFYLLSVGLMCFSGVVTDTGLSVSLGFTLVMVILGFVVMSVLFILYDLFKFVKLLALRSGKFK